MLYWNFYLEVIKVQIQVRVIIFRVKDFSDECDSIFKSTNNFYKTNQVKKFLQQLQQNIFVEIFNDSDSIQIITFEHQPIIKIDQLTGIHRGPVFKQPESNYLLARAVLMDDLFHYQYPNSLFDFPIRLKQILPNMNNSFNFL